MGSALGTRAPHNAVSLSVLRSASVPLQICELVGVDDEGLAVVFGDDVEDDAGDDKQQADDDEHDGADQGGEVRDHASADEFRGDQCAQHDTDDADDQAEPAEEGERLVFADHAEDGTHDLDAVAHRVQFGDRAFGPVAVLNRHLVEAQVVVERVDGHLGFDFEAA